MNTFLSRALILGFPLMLGVTAASALELSAGADLVSCYAFHGMTYSDGPALQPRLVVSGKEIPLVLTGWSNYELEGGHAGGVLAGAKAAHLSELDLFATYPLPLKCADLDVTLGYFNYPESLIPSDADLQFGGSKDLGLTPAGFSLVPFLRFDYLYQGSASKTLYTEGGVQGERKLAGAWSLSYRVKAAWIARKGASDVWSDLLSTLGVSYAYAESGSLCLSYNRVTRLASSAYPDELYLNRHYIQLGVSQKF